jgi:predicted Zn-dependent protease
MQKLDAPDRRHLEAAQGWLGLGNHIEANEELEKITPELRAHPDVLAMRYEVNAASKKWDAAGEIANAMCRLAPHSLFGFIDAAFALHQLKRTRDALNVLLPLVERFPDEAMLFYNLACYCCVLGDRKQALEFLKRAIDLVGSSELKLRALNDPDLAALWLDIAEI